jgi:lipopolysaccharide export LptBFGC system permease protein LptF
MRILDRYILKSFLVNYLLALCVLVGMYVLMDVIVNIQDFAKGAGPSVTGNATTSTWEVAGDMLDYYLYQLPVIYQQVAGIIPLLAAGFTMVRMTRHHELTAMMASGVSLYRVAAPIIMISMAFSVLNIVNQEFIISQPHVIEKLLRRHDEVNVSTSKNVPLWFIKDTDNSLLSALHYCPARRVAAGVQAPATFTRSAGSFIEDGLQPGLVFNASGFENAANNGDFLVVAVTDRELQVAGDSLVTQTARAESVLALYPTLISVFIAERDEAGTPIRHTLAASAQWLADPTPGETRNAWIMKKVVSEDDTGRQPDARTMDTAIRRTELTPEQIDLILSRKAVDYLSSERVHELAKYSPDVNKPLLYKIMHLRFTQPLMNIIMLLIGIPFLLTREPNRLVINMFYCTAVTGVIFVASFVMFQLGGTQIDPLWAAWLPVLIFGPFSLVMLDTIRT